MAVCFSMTLSAQSGQPPASSTGTSPTGRSAIDASSIEGGGIDAPQPADPVDPNSTPIVTTREKWNNFVHETVSLLTLGGGTFNAVFSQVTHTDPKYGGDAGAFAERFGASIADITNETDESVPDLG